MVMLLIKPHLIYQPFFTAQLIQRHLQFILLLTNPNKNRFTLTYRLQTIT